MRSIATAAVIAALGVGSATPALAQNEVSYSFLELGYVDTELDNLNVDGDGFALRGSYAFTDLFHGFASYTDTEYDFGVSAEQFELGGGLRFALNPRLDLVTTLSYVDVSVDIPGRRDADDDAIALAAGLRSRVSDALELRGEIKHFNYDKGSNDTALGFGARYYFTNQFALTGDVSVADDVGSTFLLGARFDLSK